MRPHRQYACRDLVLDVDRGCLVRDGQDVKLRPKSFQVLTCLIERHGRLVTKEELVREVWPDTFVSDDSLTKCLVEIRKALGDQVQDVVKTVPRRGYLFDAPVEERTAAPVAPRRHNLPARVTSFIGRVSELAAVVKLVKEERLVTLTGPGGSGKTRLALEAAAAPGAEFPDGIWLTELAALTEERLVVDAVAASMGLRPDADHPMLERLTQYLSARALLVVLDNCEHLLGACARLAEALLRFCPGVRILATSREPLRIGGERAWSVPCLSLPSPGAGVDAIRRAEAVTLMAERTKTVLPAFELTDMNARALAQICARLDGLPLAIELAAARARVLSLDQIATRLDDRFRLLVGGSRTALPRHQTLAGAIDWSHEMLSDPERRLFRRLSVFAGGWTLDAAASVCGDESGAIDVQVLSELVEKSLVVAEEDHAGGRRFRMLETVREYSRGRLDEAGEQELIRNRHLQYHRTLAAEARDQLIGATQAAWLRRVEVEHDNFRTALAWCEAAPERTEAGLDICSGLHWFWFKHGHFNEACRWQHRLLQLQPVHAPDARDRAAECWFSLGLSTILTGNPDEGGRYLGTSLQMARECGDDDLVIAVLRMIVHGLLEVGQIDAAESFAREGLVVADKLDAVRQATAIGTLGMVYRARGDYDRAADCFHREMAHWRVSGDTWMLAASASDTAETELRRGHADRARSLTLEMLALSDTHDAPTLAWNLEILGHALAAQGQALTAVRVWGAAEVVFERTGLKMPGYMVPACEASRKAVRAAVADDVAFDAAWQEGRRLTPTEAVAGLRDQTV